MVAVLMKKWFPTSQLVDTTTITKIVIFMWFFKVQTYSAINNFGALVIKFSDVFILTQNYPLYDMSFVQM